MEQNFASSAAPSLAAAAPTRPPLEETAFSSPPLPVDFSADVAASVAHLASPGVLRMVAASLVGGLIATTFVVVIAYYGGIAAFRLGLDPDNHGIPLVTSSMDLVGAFALVIALVLVGVV